MNKIIDEVLEQLEIWDIESGFKRKKIYIKIRTEAITLTLQKQQEEFEEMIDEADIGGYPTHRIKIILKQKISELGK